MTTPTLLDTVIRACVDDERTLQNERRFVDDWRAATLTRLASERDRFVADLEQLAASPTPRPSASWAELLREGMRGVWVTAAGQNCGDAIASCCRSRTRTEDCYDSAMQAAMPDAVRFVLAGQRSRLHEAEGELNRIRF
jgi:hypothetical protein